jgi:O-succinylbenzoic acid--CoA ligase
MSTLHVYNAAREAPGRVALVVDGQPRTWSELAERIGPVLNDVFTEGLLPGSREPYALVAQPDLATILKLLALITAGVPAHLIHPALTQLERQALIDALGPIETPPALRTPDEPPLARGSLDVPDVDARDEHPLAVVYTSGTSGRARGVILSRRAFVWSARASEANLGWRDDDRWLLRIPVAHIGGLSTVTRCLLARRCLVLADAQLDLLDQLERDRVTIVSLVPTQLRRLIDDAPARRPPAHLRAVLLGGGPAPADLLADAADVGWPVLTTYGLTEACSQVATQQLGTVNRGELGSGRALPGVELRIVDGVIQVRGRMLFSGYHPATAESVFTDDGFFVTGDRGRLDEQGNLQVIGRATDLIVTGGENVDPYEVEAALRDLPGVADACVFGVPDREWGERVAAVIVPAAEEPDRRALDAALRQRLAPFKRPRAIAFARELSLTPSGKVDRRAAARTFTDRLMPTSPQE